MTALPVQSRKRQMGNGSTSQAGRTPSAQQLSLSGSNDAFQTLSRLCDLVAGSKQPYEDVAEQIEDRAYELCEAGNLDKVVQRLGRVAHFFEHLVNKNEEQCRDLADVYLLIGQIYQYAGGFAESISWFTRSAVVDDRYPAPFHSMADSYSQLHESDNAIKSLEQEIVLAPGNYYSYLLLADLYESDGRNSDVETCLQRLLERDPENIQGLHRIIRHYEFTAPSIDTTLMKRRLLGVSKQFNRTEAVIRCYYLCREGKYIEVIDFLEKRRREADGGMVASLIKAYVYGEMHQFSRRRQVLTEFKLQHHAHREAIEAKLREFGAVFGEKASTSLQKILLLPRTDPASDYLQ
ncbi:MAG: tetratricopeptide repeat protein [Chitinispirillaceae bacterium]|nr:tetratricopeptide repeat protein [Chitinispirillaceae bacterium]